MTSSLSNLSPEEKRALLKRLLAERDASAPRDQPLAYGQRALWFLQQLLPDSHAYNVGFAARFQPRLDLSALQRALNRVVERHEVLRSTFPAPTAEPVRRVDASATATLRVIEMPDASDDQAFDAIVAEYRRPFDLATGAFAATVVRREHEDALLLNAHHLVFDAWSLEVLFEDLRELYDAELTGRPAQLAAAEGTYADFVATEARALSGAQGEALHSYWATTLNGDLPLLDISNRPRPPRVQLRGSSVPYALGPEVSKAVYQLSRQQGKTLHTVCLALMQIALHKLSGQEDVVIGTPVGLRSDHRFDRVVGYFVNTLPVRGSVHDEDTLLDLLGRARSRMIEALEHQAYPFSLMVDRLHVSREANRNPIFQAMLNVLVAPRPTTLARLMNGTGDEAVFGRSRVTLYELPQSEGQFELAIEVTDAAGVLQGNIRYQTDVYERERVEEIREVFTGMAEAAIMNPSTPVGKLVMRPRDEFEL